MFTLFTLCIGFGLGCWFCVRWQAMNSIYWQAAKVAFSPAKKESK